MEAWVGKDGLAQLVESLLGLGSPGAAKGLGVFACHDGAERRHAQLKAWDEFAVKLQEANEACHIMNQCGCRPVFQQLVL